jgi:hypothetical protein
MDKKYTVTVSVEVCVADETIYPENYAARHVRDILSPWVRKEGDWGESYAIVTGRRVDEVTERQAA